MAVKTAVKAAPKAAPRAREEEPSRMDERAPDKMPERDNIIRNRLGEPVSIQRLLDKSDDKYALDRLGVIPPPGWVYGWKTKTIKNWEWRSHMVELQNKGWTPVPANRHDGMIMPKGHNGPIEEDGLVLMERDIRAENLARNADAKLANQQLDTSRSMSGLMGANIPGSAMDAIDFNNAEARNHPQNRVVVTRQPRLPDRNYTLEE